MKYAADPLFKAECLGYRAACSSIKWLEMTNQDAKQKEIRSLNKEQEIGTVTHDCLHCRGTRDKGGAGGRTQKKRWAYGCKRCCGTLRRARRTYLRHAANLRQTSYKWPAFSSARQLEMANCI